MTTIIAAKTKDAIYMAADGLSSADYDALSYNVKKLHRIKQGAIGFAGLSRCAQLFAEAFSDTKFRSPADLAEQFQVQLRRQPEIQANDLTWNALLAFEGKLYRIDSSFCALREDYASIGSGRDLAKGALEAYLTVCDGISEKLLRDCIKIASKWDLATGGRIASLTVPR